jgi:hypothetical protein
MQSDVPSEHVQQSNQFYTFLDSSNAYAATVAKDQLHKIAKIYDQLVGEWAAVYDKTKKYRRKDDPDYCKLAEWYAKLNDALWKQTEEMKKQFEHSHRPAPRQSGAATCDLCALCGLPECSTLHETVRRTRSEFRGYS